MIAVVKPIGLRSTFAAQGQPGTSNTWQHHADLHAEMIALYGGTLDPEMSNGDHDDAKSALLDLMRKAMQGSLHMVEGVQLQSRARYVEAKPIRQHGCEYMLELRPRTGRGAFGKPARIVRLYYMEPETSPNNLYSLHLATKPNAEDADSEQNHAIFVSDRRAQTSGFPGAIAS